MQARAKLLVVSAHPNPKSYTRAVYAAVLAGAREAGADVQAFDLNDEQFDPVLVVNEQHRRRDLDQVEATRRYRELLAWADAVVFVYPVWWGGFPAVLKGFIDRTFVSGLTYTFKDRSPTAVFPTGLMRGKDAHFFYTLDSPWLVAWLDPGWWSTYFTVFKYCGFRSVRRHYLWRLKLTSQARREAWLAEVQRRARRLSAEVSAP